MPVYAGYTPAETRRALRRKAEPSYQGTFMGARRYVLHTFATTQSALMKTRVARFMTGSLCPGWRGKRLKRASLEVTFAGHDIGALSQRTLSELAAVFGPAAAGRPVPALPEERRIAAQRIAVNVIERVRTLESGPLEGLQKVPESHTARYLRARPSTPGMPRRPGGWLRLRGIRLRNWVRSPPPPRTKRPNFRHALRLPGTSNPSAASNAWSPSTKGPSAVHRARTWPPIPVCSTRFDPSSRQRRRRRHAVTTPAGFPSTWPRGAVPPAKARRPGGRVVVCGTPHEVAAAARGRTAPYLAAALRELRGPPGDVTD